MRDAAEPPVCPGQPVEQRRGKTVAAQLQLQRDLDRDARNDSAELEADRQPDRPERNQGRPKPKERHRQEKSQPHRRHQHRDDPGAESLVESRELLPSDKRPGRIIDEAFHKGSTIAVKDENEGEEENRDAGLRVSAHKQVGISDGDGILRETDFQPSVFFFMRRFVAVLVILYLATGCGPRLTPEDKARRVELQRAIEAQEYGRALPLAERVARDFPGHDFGWERLVHAHLGQGDVAAAQEAMARWKAKVRRPDWQFDELSGDIALRKNEPEGALGAWREAAERGKNSRPLRKIARLLGEQQRWAAADEAWSNVIAQEETGPDLMERARVRRYLRRWPEALEDARRAQALTPGDPAVRSTAQLFERLSKFIEAIQELDARLAVTPGDNQLLADRALLLLRSGDPELALADATAAGELAPWAMRPRLFGGLAWLALGRPEEAAKLGLNRDARLEMLTPEFLETVSRLDSEISLERSNAELFVARAWQLNELAQPGLARQDAEMALRLDANNAGAHVEMAYALAKLGQSEEAFGHIQRATEADPNYSTAWHYRGELEMARGDCAAAIASFTRALAINQTVATLQKREECYIKLGQLEDAENDHRALEALR